MDDLVLTERSGGVGVVTLNSVKTLNSLSVPMIESLHRTLTEWCDDREIACVFLQGAGEKAFCAGGDVRRLHGAIVAQRERAPGVPPDDVVQFFAKEYRLDFAIHTYPKPIVVWGDGIVMGGGIGLMAGASHRVVTERSHLAMPEITIGLYPDVAGTWFLNKMKRGWGLFLGLTGARLGAGDSLHLGLADFFVSSEQRADLLAALAELKWTDRAEANRELATKTLRSFGAQGQSALPASAAEAHGDRVAQIADAPSLPEFRARLAAAAEADAWFQRGLRSFDSGSPSSAAIIREQLRRGQGLSLADVFRSELNLSVQCALHPDFAEGVRALLVDKDQAPKWQPASLADLTSAWIESYFAPLWTADAHPLKNLGDS